VNFRKTKNKRIKEENMSNAQSLASLFILATVLMFTTSAADAGEVNGYLYDGLGALYATPRDVTVRVYTAGGTLLNENTADLTARYSLQFPAPGAAALAAGTQLKVEYWLPGACAAFHVIEGIMGQATVPPQPVHTFHVIVP